VLFLSILQIKINYTSQRIEHVPAIHSRCLLDVDCRWKQAPEGCSVRPHAQRRFRSPRGHLLSGAVLLQRGYLLDAAAFLLRAATCSPAPSFSSGAICSTPPPSFSAWLPTRRCCCPSPRGRLLDGAAILHATALPFSTRPPARRRRLPSPRGLLLDGAAVLLRAAACSTASLL